MVDNRGISPINTLGFTDANSMANKMSEEKYGQGGEYFITEEGEQEEKQEQAFQDRSAALRASLNGLAAANVGSIKFMEAVNKKARESDNKRRRRREENTRNEDEIYEILDE